MPRGRLHDLVRYSPTPHSRCSEVLSAGTMSRPFDAASLTVNCARKGLDHRGLVKDLDSSVFRLHDACSACLSSAGTFRMFSLLDEVVKRVFEVQQPFLRSQSNMDIIF